MEHLEINYFEKKEFFSNTLNMNSRNEKYTERDKRNVSKYRMNE